MALQPLQSLKPEPGRPDRSNPQSVDVLDLLRKLGRLRDAGLLSQEHYETERAELLTRLWGW
jgi:hypothetical protein